MEKNMTLGEAIDILKIEKGCADLDISNGKGNQHDEDLSEALKTVLDWVDKMYFALMRLK